MGLTGITFVSRERVTTYLVKVSYVCMSPHNQFLEKFCPLRERKKKRRSHFWVGGEGGKGFGLYMQEFRQSHSKLQKQPAINK